MRWVAPAARRIAFSPALAVSTQNMPGHSSGAMSAKVGVLSDQGFQTTVVDEPLFSMTMRRAQAASSITQAAVVLTWTWSV